MSLLVAIVAIAGVAFTCEAQPSTGGVATPGAGAASGSGQPSGQIAPSPGAPRTHDAAPDIGSLPSPGTSSTPGADAPDHHATALPQRGEDQAVAAATNTPFVSIPANETIVPVATPTRTPTRTATPASTNTPQPGGVPAIGGCSVFPANNAWNTDVSAYALHPNSQNYINSILGAGGTGKLHPDFGSNPAYGIPYIVVAQSEPLVPINFTDYGDESDPGPYPIPLNAPNEGGGDRHVLAVQQGTCKLFELFAATAMGDHWDAASGAVFDLSSNALRPEGWTSADAAGLPIVPGLVRYDEVQAGAIRHALRFTISQSQRAYIHPATHYASSSTDPNRPPMGLRLRLKASYDISGFTGQSRVVLQALKTYGMIVADNGSNWYISGGRDSRWDDDDLNQLKTVPGSAFEAVYTGPLIGP
jgi:hypothetical protein